MTIDPKIVAEAERRVAEMPADAQASGGLPYKVGFLDGYGFALGLGAQSEAELESGIGS